MNKHKLPYLLKCYFEGALTPEEEKQLLELLTNNPSEDILAQFDEYYKQYGKAVPFLDHQQNQVWENIVRQQQENGTARPSRMIFKYAAVAIVLLIGTVGLFKSFYKTESRNNFSAIENFSFDNRAPLLSLREPGQNFRLLNEYELQRYGVFVHANGTTFINTQEDRIQPDNLELKINTKKGQLHQVFLPDGSQVLLSANSEINVPLVFDKHVRSLSLIGNAYFDVMGNKAWPFHVKTPHNVTRVLGTNFNVNATVGKEEEITLLEGAVKIYNKENSILLKPGEQAFGNNALQKRKADLKKVTAWQQGYLYFDNLTIRELMNSINEWYNLEFVSYDYESDDRFSGSFKRTNSLEELLQNLQEVSSIRFKVKEGGVYVLKK
ncbi:FecR family protein [Sphingobacterium tabacisoli]|uniref:FecR family protein n=1 Tax=Sphingobacterium tabacisoli TaxID=2044855 RepID=A0ABW5L8S8_9SPHI|nr:FecR domain-containing protein [Sphingobacterium tabacisoli]